ncbi:MAG: sugar nucleotide-binding protein [Oligoflexia bacterium]|nr:sugar nucleotide-binding protein [Oligoflexia bacterium]
MKRCLLIGKNGQVARSLYTTLNNGINTKTEYTSSKQDQSSLYLSLDDMDSIRSCFEQWDAPKDSIVYLAGALTNVEKCEVEKEECRKKNRDGVIAIAQECKRKGYKLCFFSTEYVFGLEEYSGGRIGPFTEDDPVSPPCYYGECKAEAEKAILEIHGEYSLILRTTMVFSWEKDGLNFLMQYIRHMRSWKEGERKFLIPTDQISTPTYAPFLADAAVELMNNNARGIYHIANRDLLSRWEMLQIIAKVFGFSESTVLAAFSPVKTESMGQKAKRPLTAGLSVDKLIKAGIHVPSFEDSLLLAKNLSV